MARARVDEIVEDPAEQVAAALADRARLAAVLASLSATDRDVLLLVAWVELTSEEAAKALGIAPGTVRTRLHRARTKVRAALDKAALDRAALDRKGS